MTSVIHDKLGDQNCLPKEHYVDSGYTTADNLAEAAKIGVDLCGPVGSRSWQARAGQGFDIGHFEIDWSAQTATLFYGFFSRSWREGVDKNGNPVVRIAFSGLDCLSCLDRAKCTTAKKGPRILTVRSQDEHEALQAGRQRQKTDEFKQAYIILKVVKVSSLWGYALLACEEVAILVPICRLQHILTATAMNLTRTVTWLAGIPRKKTYVSL